MSTAYDAIKVFNETISRFNKENNLNLIPSGDGSTVFEELTMLGSGVKSLPLNLEFTFLQEDDLTLLMGMQKDTRSPLTMVQIAEQMSQASEMVKELNQKIRERHGISHDIAKLDLTPTLFEAAPGSAAPLCQAAITASADDWIKYIVPLIEAEVLPVIQKNAVLQRDYSQKGPDGQHAQSSIRTLSLQQIADMPEAAKTALLNNPTDQVEATNREYFVSVGIGGEVYANRVSTFSQDLVEYGEYADGLRWLTEQREQFLGVVNELLKPEPVLEALSGEQVVEAIKKHCPAETLDELDALMSKIADTLPEGHSFKGFYRAQIGLGPIARARDLLDDEGVEKNQPTPGNQPPVPGQWAGFVKNGGSTPGGGRFGGM